MSPSGIREWEGPGWKVLLSQDGLAVHSTELERVISISELSRTQVVRRWFRWRLILDGDTVVNLRGLTRSSARLLRLSQQLIEVRQWTAAVKSTFAGHRSQGRWISRDVVESMATTRPGDAVAKLIRRWKLREQLTQEELEALNYRALDLFAEAETANQEILASELEKQRTFLDNIESQPLSAEQAEAVITFDNRTLVVAAAGSGKTSVMVARAAYAVAKGFIDPTRILLLAFNRDAAAELQERVQLRFEAAGLDASGIRASTFHAFGLDVLGQARGARPRVAPWVDKGIELEELADIVRELRSSSDEFAYNWDLFRLVLSPSTVKLSGVNPDAWNPDSRTSGFRTFDGKVVRSHGERMIADWLYLHGVNYEYERSYSHYVASASHRQYHPDFYYPEIDTWHEHWALDLQGNPPQEFRGYFEEMRWKCALHKRHGTELIETTYGKVVYSDGLQRLRDELNQRGIPLSWDPERPRAAYTGAEDINLIKLMRTFMTHVKSGSLTQEDLQTRLVGGWRHLRGFRTQVFLNIYWPIHQAWNERLQKSDAIDFEDMLAQAADEVLQERFTPQYDLLLVDEFQDSSVARSRLIKALLDRPGKFLLAVGDDWQAINRFAGADISLMTGFHKHFGAGPTVKLTKTYRCTETIAQVATTFISKNPKQIQKEVSSTREDPGPPVVLVRAVDRRAGVSDALLAIANDARSCGLDQAEVYVLGRYGFDKDWLPEDPPSGLNVSFRTVHGSKGLEADYVVVVNLEAGRYGFPSEIEDDPISDLVMAAPDGFEHAEERRLLYVALTRAKRQAYLVTREHKDSAFAVELIEGELVRILQSDTTEVGAADVKLCPECKKGTMVLRTGRYGEFYGCARFPQCTATMDAGGPRKERSGQYRRRRR